MSPAPTPNRDDRPTPLPAAWLDLVVADECTDDAARALLGRAPTDDERAALSSARGHLRALRSLSRVVVPESLDGLVVASLEAGHRQDRAVAVLGSLEGMAAPTELDGLVDDAVRRGVAAPRVLDRLVAERVDDPEAGLVRSMAGRLERLHAPDALDDRVLEPSGYGAGSTVRRAAGLGILGSVALAAALVLVARLSGGAVDEPELEPTGPTFTIVRYDSFESAGLTDADRALFSSISGEPYGDRS